MLEKGTIMSGSSPKQLEANKRTAQRSTGPQTPCDGVAAIPVLSEAEGSDRGSQTSALKPLGVRADMPMESIAVAFASRLRIAPPALNTLKNVLYQNAIKHQLYKSGDACGLSLACKNTVAFPTLTPRRPRLSTKVKNYQTNPFHLTLAEPFDGDVKLE
jgi:hypothetical protein